VTDAPRRRPTTLWTRLLVAALLGLPLLALAAFLRPAGRPAGDAPGGTGPPPGKALDVPGIREPRAVPAADAGLGDDEPVVGVQAGGRARAYRVGALSMGQATHVVNDVLGGVPVSVTYCNMHHCARTFTGAAAGGPLALSQGGLVTGSMVLRAGGRRYRQDSGAALDPDAPPFPYAAYPREETTWGQWRRAHPDSDVYLGFRAGEGPRHAGGG
jgi:hypothetical protein